MREDLEICVADFKELIDKLNWAIANKALTPLLVADYEISMQEIVDQVRAMAIEALEEQEEGE